MRQELFLQRTAALNEQRAINRLVRHPHTVVRGECFGKPAGDLSRGPALSQLLTHHPAQSAVSGEQALLGSMRVAPSLLIGLQCSVVPAAPVTANLSAD